MATPISSLQNILGVNALAANFGVAVSFGSWLLFSMPLCCLGVVLAWSWIVFLYPVGDVAAVPKIIMPRQGLELTSPKALFMLGCSLLTLFFWSTSSTLFPFFGDASVVSLLFIVLMFGTGMLSEVEFNSFTWHVLFLLGGGNILGEIVSSSGLLAHLAEELFPNSAKELQSSPVILFVLLFFVTVMVASFVSHSVAAIVLIPFVAHTAKADPDLAAPLVLGASLVVSAAMALPFSSFPNVNSALVTDDVRVNYLHTKDFVKVGVPMSVLSVLLVILLSCPIIAMIYD